VSVPSYSPKQAAGRIGMALLTWSSAELDSISALCQTNGDGEGVGREGEREWMFVYFG
jgi:hypothetical protein